MNIVLGYEVGTGRPVTVPLKHTAVLGQTQESGKTTTQEAMIIRSGLRAVAFITKRGEKSFRLSKPIPAFFRESISGPFWKYVSTIVEGALELKLGFQERGYLMMLCEENKKTVTTGTGKKKRQEIIYEWGDAKSLADLQNNLKVAKNQLRGTAKMICIQLAEYLSQVMPEIVRAKFSDTLNLSAGINVMDIAKLSVPLQALVIRSTIEWVLRHERNTVVVVPEAWKFIGKKSTPVKAAAEQFIREGATLQNYLWLDSQDLRGVDPLLLRSIGVWIFGVQRERNEVANTLDSIPDLPKPQAADIMRLKKGQFYAAFGDTCVLTYVRPAGMGEEHAKAIARGEESADSWKRIVAELETEDSYPGSNSETTPGENPAGSEPNIEPAGTEKSVREEIQNHGGEPESYGMQAENEDEMWKERAEKAEAELESLRAQLQELRQQMFQPPPVSDARTNYQAPNTPLASNGTINTEALWIEFLSRLRKDPVLLHIAVTKPEIAVTIKRQTVEMNSETLIGSIACMLHRGFFKLARESAQVRAELIRTGGADRLSNANLANALAKLHGYGFLTKESTGWQEVPGMKVNLIEAK